MGLTFVKLLGYFGVPELKDALRDINEIQTGTRLELAKRVHATWLTYNRKVEDLLDFLDVDVLTDICYDYQLGHKGNYETLKRRIKKELEKINPKPYNPETTETKKRKSKEKNNPTQFANIVVISIVIIIVIVTCYIYFNGIVPTKTITLTSTGGFIVQQNPNFPPDIDMIINFKTSSLSAQNPIDVEAKMIPSEYFDTYKPDPWPYLPSNQFVLFPGAIKYPPKQFSDGSYVQAYINLTKSDNPREYSGIGKILYQTEGDFGYLFVGPKEINEHSVNEGTSFSLNELNDKINKFTIFHVSSDQTVLHNLGKYSIMGTLIGFAITVVKYRNKIAYGINKFSNKS